MSEVSVSVCFCRTCKYWSQNANMIGVGNCLNTEVLLKIFLPNQFLVTAQNFGCVCHEEGECQACIWPKGDIDKMWKEYLESKRYDFQRTTPPE